MIGDKKVKQDLTKSLKFMTTYHDEKRNKVKEQYYIDSKGLYSGEYLSFYKNGNVNERLFYTNGKLEGKQKFFDENGKLKEEKLCKKNKIVVNKDYQTGNIFVEIDGVEYQIGDVIFCIIGKDISFDVKAMTDNFYITYETKDKKTEIILKSGEDKNIKKVIDYFVKRSEDFKKITNITIDNYDNDKENIKVFLPSEQDFNEICELLTENKKNQIKQISIKNNKDKTTNIWKFNKKNEKIKVLQSVGDDRQTEITKYWSSDGQFKEKIIITNGEQFAPMIKVIDFSYPTTEVKGDIKEKIKYIKKGTKINAASDIEGDIRLYILYFILCGAIDASKFPDGVKQLLGIDKDGRIKQEVKNLIKDYFDLRKKLSSRQISTKKEHEVLKKIKKIKEELHSYIKPLSQYTNDDYQNLFKLKGKLKEAVQKVKDDNLIMLLNGDLLSLRPFFKIQKCTSKDEVKNLICNITGTYELILDIFEEVKKKNGENFVLITGNHDNTLMFERFSLPDFVDKEKELLEFCDKQQQRIYDVKKKLVKYTIYSRLYQTESEQGQGKQILYTHTANEINVAKDDNFLVAFLERQGDIIDGGRDRNSMKYYIGQDECFDIRDCDFNDYLNYYTFARIGQIDWYKHDVSTKIPGETQAECILPNKNRIIVDGHRHGLYRILDDNRDKLNKLSVFNTDFDLQRESNMFAFLQTEVMDNGLLKQSYLDGITGQTIASGEQTLESEKERKKNAETLNEQIKQKHHYDVLEGKEIIKEELEEEKIKQSENENVDNKKEEQKKREEEEKKKQEEEKKRKEEEQKKREEEKKRKEEENENNKKEENYDEKFTPEANEQNKKITELEKKLEVALNKINDKENTIKKLQLLLEQKNKDINDIQYTLDSVKKEKIIFEQKNKQLIDKFNNLSKENSELKKQLEEINKNILPQININKQEKETQTEEEKIIQNKKDKEIFLPFLKKPFGVQKQLQDNNGAKISSNIKRERMIAASNAFSNFFNFNNVNKRKKDFSKKSKNKLPKTIHNDKNQFDETLKIKNNENIKINLKKTEEQKWNKIP